VLAAAVAVPAALPAQGVTKVQYGHAVTDVLLQLRTDFRSAGRVRQISPALRAMKTALDRTAVRLVRLRAPADAAAAQRSLVGGIRDYARQIDLVRASVDFGDVATIASHLRDVTAPKAINRTLDRLAALGYRIPVRVSSPR
jgi:hypothetical protein